MFTHFTDVIKYDGVNLLESMVALSSIEPSKYENRINNIMEDFTLGTTELANIHFDGFNGLRQIGADEFGRDRKKPKNKAEKQIMKIAKRYKKMFKYFKECKDIGENIKKQNHDFLAKVRKSVLETTDNEIKDYQAPYRFYYEDTFCDKKFFKALVGVEYMYPITKFQDFYGKKVWESRDPLTDWIFKEFLNPVNPKFEKCKSLRFDWTGNIPLADINKENTIKQFEESHKLYFELDKLMTAYFEFLDKCVDDALKTEKYREYTEIYEHMYTVSFLLHYYLNAVRIINFGFMQESLVHLYLINGNNQIRLPQYTRL